MEWLAEIVNGTVTGLVVAAALWLIERSSQPRLELHRIDDETALLRNHGLRTVAFGDTFALEQGEGLLFPKDGFRGQISEMRCKGRNEIVVGCAIRLGESLTITYKPLSFAWLSSSRLWRRIQNEAQQADVMTIIGRKSQPWWKLSGFRDRVKKTEAHEWVKPTRLWGWKFQELPLKPM